jgi:hypothetical protein
MAEVAPKLVSIAAVDEPVRARPATLIRVAVPKSPTYATECVDQRAVTVERMKMFTSDISALRWIKKQIHTRASKHIIYRAEKKTNPHESKQAHYL